MKILLIEDNSKISDNIKKFLESEGLYKVSQSFDGEQGLEKMKKEKFDLIVLDLMLPSISGIEVCKKIREKSSIPVIITTAKFQDNDKIIGLESGADDYIVKPFKLRELELRIKSILSRQKKQQEKIKIGNIEVDLEKKEVKKNGKIINLTFKELSVLEAIIINKSISRTELIEKVWLDSSLFNDDAKLDVNISIIRKKLDKKIIKTIKGYGYSINM